jgi:hypothetical protein
MSFLLFIYLSTLLLCRLFNIHKPVPVAARSKLYVFGRSSDEIVGSNPTGRMDVSLLWVLCVLSGSGLCSELITRPEDSYRLWCVVVCDLGTSRMRRPWPTGECCAKNKQKFIVIEWIWIMSGVIACPYCLRDFTVNIWICGYTFYWSNLNIFHVCGKTQRVFKTIDKEKNVQVL